MNANAAVKSAIEGLIKEYVKITKKYKSKDKNIYLGRSFSVGSLFQYTLAEKLFSNSKYFVLVDCPITIKGRKQPLYPDILLIKKKNEKRILVGIIEVKIDLGYLPIERYGIETEEKSEYTYNRKENDFMAAYKHFSESKDFTYKELNEEGVKEKSEPIIISRKLKKIAFVVTKANDHGRSKFFERALKDADFKVVFALEKNHPNAIKKLNKKGRRQFAILNKELRANGTIIKNALQSF